MVSTAGRNVQIHTYCGCVTRIDVSKVARMKRNGMWDAGSSLGCIASQNPALRFRIMLAASLK